QCIVVRNLIGTLCLGQEVHGKTLTLCFSCVVDIGIVDDALSDTGIVANLLLGDWTATTGTHLVNLLECGLIDVASTSMFLDDVVRKTGTLTLERVERDTNGVEQSRNLLSRVHVLVVCDAVELHVCLDERTHRLNVVLGELRFLTLDVLRSVAR